MGRKGRASADEQTVFAVVRVPGFRRNGLTKICRTIWLLEGKRSFKFAQTPRESACIRSASRGCRGPNPIHGHDKWLGALALPRGSWPHCTCGHPRAPRSATLWSCGPLPRPGHLLPLVRPQAGSSPLPGTEPLDQIFQALSSSAHHGPCRRRDRVFAKRPSDRRKM